MDRRPSNSSHSNSLESTIMAQMNAILGGNTTAASAAPSFSNTPTSSSPPRPSVAPLPLADINSAQPDNRVNLARIMNRLSDLIAHLHEHYQATMPQEGDDGTGSPAPKCRQTSTEFKLWIGRTRRGAQQVLTIRARTLVAVQLPGQWAKKSKVLGEYPQHLEEYFGLFCANIATNAGVKYSIVHDLGFEIGMEQGFGAGGSWKHPAEDEMEGDGEGGALELEAIRVFVFPKGYWAFCVAVAGPVVVKVAE